MSSKQLPSTGRDVGYYTAPGVLYAAKITQVHQTAGPVGENDVGLVVFRPDGLDFPQQVPYGPDKPGHWGWMPYVPPIRVES